MFQPLGTRPVPDFDDFRGPAQVVDVPMDFRVGIQVMVEPGAQAAGAEGAPSIYVKTGLKGEGSKFPDEDCPSLFGLKNQGVSSGNGWDVRGGLRRIMIYS
jgi:hypothetical protein